MSGIQSTGGGGGVTSEPNAQYVSNCPPDADESWGVFQDGPCATGTHDSAAFGYGWVRLDCRRCLSWVYPCGCEKTWAQKVEAAHNEGSGASS